MMKKKQMQPNEIWCKDRYHLIQELQLWYQNDVGTGGGGVTQKLIGGSLAGRSRYDLVIYMSRMKADQARCTSNECKWIKMN